MTMDAIQLEVMSHTFAGIAEEMGSLLVASALSPNVRERRDSSAAIFSSEGELVAQAAHIPVHLGAMPEAVNAVRRKNPGPEDTFIVNDPYTGGTHLPDITLVHSIGWQGRVVGYAVVRAHHADVGGSQPGSMPAHSRELFQEGLVIPPVQYAHAGTVIPAVEELLLANLRNPEVRRGDLAAQLAACQRGGGRLRELMVRFGGEVLFEGQRDLLDYAERRTVASLRERLGTASFEGEDWLEGDGTTDRDLTIRALLRLVDGKLVVDFDGSASASPGNVNCPLSVTRSAVLFVVRCLIDADIPSNGGVHRAVSVRAPAGSLVNAQWPSAVAAGNVETSQRVTDVLFKALGGLESVPAQGQGTMNNVIMGGRGWTYYETLGGGQGASSRGDGPSGVHVGMSNTRNTPIEVIEMDHPLRVTEYRLRESSGGGGRHRGGDGVVRVYQAREELQVNLITERRRHAPQGANGGEPGALGRNSVNGESVPAKASLTLEPGDELRIETPGGGGWGAPLV